MRGFFKGLLGFFTGKGGGKIIDAANKLHYSKQERAEDAAADVKGARTMPLPTGGTNAFDVFVNGCNRLVRPGVTLWLVGGFVGWWTLPPTDLVDPYWHNALLIVLTFWFGGRMLLKDLPAAIRSLKSIRG